MSEGIYKRKGGSVWYADIVGPDGKRHQISTKCRDKRAALAQRIELERQLFDPAYAAAHAETLRDAIDKLLAERKERGKPEGTLRMLRSKGGHLERLMGSATALAKINSASVDKYVSARRAEKASDVTIYKEWSTLRGALRLALRAGTWHGSLEALRPVGLSGKSEPRKRRLSQEEAQRLLADLLSEDIPQRRGTMKHRAAHVAFILATGCRWSESVAAERRDVDWTKRVVYIRGTKTKKAAAEIPILAMTARLLQLALAFAPGWATGKLFAPWGAVRGDLRRACARLKIAPVTPNDLRRTLASWLRAAGVDNDLSRRVLRQTTTKQMEETYGQLSPDEMRSQIDRFTGERHVCDTSSAGLPALPALPAHGPALPTPRDR